MSDTEDPRAEELVEGLNSAFEQSLQVLHRGLNDTVGRLGGNLRLPMQDIDQLIELGRTVIHEGDVGKVAERIRVRQSASDLALVIATMMQGVEFSSPEEAKAARERMLGALFGAFVGIRTGRMREAVLGAMGGALAFSIYPILHEMLKENELSWRQWSEM